MSESWHIPRASLAGSSTSASSNSSSKSHSNPSTVSRYPLTSSRHTEIHSNLAYINDHEEKIRGVLEEGTRGNKKNRLNDTKNHSSTYELYNDYYNNFDKLSGRNRSNEKTKNERRNSDHKRGSRSSQGSTDSSNNSTHSASSGSLLLTAANLERFAAIHKKQNKIEKRTNMMDNNRQNYNTNITMSQQQNQQKLNSKSDDIHLTSSLSKTNVNNDAVIEIDPNLHFVKTKDVDTVSIASSTHFTMVNGVGVPPKKIKEGLCSRGHQVTVLIVSMSFFFLIGISTMVYLLEMRAREMPQ